MAFSGKSCAVTNCRAASAFSVISTDPIIQISDILTYGFKPEQRLCSEINSDINFDLLF
jgi:hypothetical protein